MLDAHHLIAEHTELDRNFVPMSALDPRRVHVTAVGADWQLLVDGSRCFATRECEGGAIDLVMHLWRVSSKQAVKTLHEVAA